MFVIARNSTFTYKGKAVKVRQVAEELGVRYVLEGSVQRSGERVRVTAQLIDAIEGHHLWSERYDRKMDDLFSVLDEITLKIVVALDVKLTAGPQARAGFGATDNLLAWSHAIRGVGHMRRYTPSDNRQARELFKQAVELDPDYVTGWVYLGYTHVIDVRNGWSESPAADLSRAAEIAEKALALDDSSSNAHILQGTVHRQRGEFDQAIAEGEKSIALDRNNSIAHALLAVTLI